jgi:hypothetical protein
MSLSGTFLYFDRNSLKLIALAKQNGEDTIIVGGVGTMFAQADKSQCVNITSSFTEESKQTLIEVVQLASSLNMTLYVGLLTIDINSGAVYEWDGRCMNAYLSLQNDTARTIVDILKPYEYNWYIPQEADLDALTTENNCDADGETVYMQKLSANLKRLAPSKLVLASPYYPAEKSPEYIKKALSNHIMCCSGIDIVSPQDGCGSFGLSPQVTKKYFELMAEDPYVRARLWANIEMFLPKAKICETASSDRITQQLESVSMYVKKAIHFWAYNLPGAPKC